MTGLAQFPARYYLIVQRGAGLGTAYALQGNMITIGRQLDNYVVIDDSQVSRRHVRLSWEGNGYSLEDLKSKNGTWVNDMRVSKPVALKVGDAIDLGPRLRLVFSDQPEIVTESQTQIQPNVTIVPPKPVTDSIQPERGSSRSGLGVAVFLLVVLALLLCVGCMAIVLYFFGYLGS